MQGAIHLGDELGIDLWVKPSVGVPQSLLIRTTTPDGLTKSSFMHIGDTVEQIPVFDSQDPLVLKSQEKRSTREFEWKPDISENRRKWRLISQTSLALCALIVLASLVAGVVQLRVVLTGSMQPSINPGDLIVAVSKDLVKPEIGKVVLYGARDLQGKVVTVWSHRIISGSATEGFTIKGDANASPDIGKIAVSDIQSVVVTRIPFVGHLFNFYSLLLISSGLLLLSISSARRKRSL